MTDPAAHAPAREALALCAALAQHDDTTALLRSGLDLGVRLLDCERGMLVARLPDERIRVLEQTAATDNAIPCSSTALRLAGSKGEPLLISDTVGDETLGVQASIQGHDIRSILCARLPVADAANDNEEVYLYLDSRIDRHPFSREHLELFRELIALMAALVRKSQLLSSSEDALEELRARVSQQQSDDLVFSSPAFARSLELVRQAAPTAVPVLLLGETGTGKEVLAQTVHRLGPSPQGPFLAVNCGAIPPALIESQLFGHVKGAFTGAVAEHRGYFESADGGTLFLDEIGELPLDMQTRLLRVLQEGEITRVGATQPVAVQVRIVSATNVDLEAAVAKGTFRADLLYRINVITVPVPPVRERGGDALLLATHFLSRYAATYGKKGVRFSREAQKALAVYEWPGNIREIQNRVQRAVITALSPLLTPTDLGISPPDKTRGTTLYEAREALDREMITDALTRSPGNLTNAARILGIDRKSLRILLEKYSMGAQGSQPH